MVEILPEGTDHIVPGAADTRASTASARERLKSEAADLKERAAGKASELKDQATDKARSYAEEGKARASGALDSVAKLIGDGAGHMDEHLGASYGDYARRAAETVSGFSDTLREKDVDALLEDARDLVRRSPAIAIGAAAAAGFVLARLLKAGSDALQEVAEDVTPAPAPKAAKDEAEATVSKAARKAPSTRRRKPASDA